MGKTYAIHELVSNKYISYYPNSLAVVLFTSLIVASFLSLSVVLVSPSLFESFHPTSLKLSSKSLSFVWFASVSHRTQIENFVVCARRKRRRSSGHQRTARYLLKSLSLLTRNLQILPQPLDFVIAELGGGDGGGGLGCRRGFGGWGGSDGWRRKGKRISLSVLFWIIVGFFAFCIISGKESKSDMILPVLGFCFFCIALVKEWKIKAKDLVLGFFCLGASLLVGLKNEHFVNLAEEIRSASSVFIHKKRNKRTHRRA